MDVFLSRPNWVHADYQPGLKVFLERLKDLNLNPRTIGATDYPTKAPLDEVIKLMKMCKGAVIIGYPQIEIKAGLIKDKDVDSQVLLPTEWNHIEAGLAYASELPLLVVHHIGITRGIFDRGALNSFLFEKDLKDPAWSCGEDLAGAIRSWRDDVLGFSPISDSTRFSVHDALSKQKDVIWTVEAVGRRITDPRPVGSRHRESAECRIEELSEFYVRIRLLSSDTIVSIPFGDIAILHDDKRMRPMMRLTA